MRRTWMALCFALAVSGCGGGTEESEITAGPADPATTSACRAYTDPDEVAAVPREGLTVSTIRALALRAEDPTIKRALSRATTAYGDSDLSVPSLAAAASDAVILCRQYFDANGLRP